MKVAGRGAGRTRWSQKGDVTVKVLVAVASKHGSTVEIAQAVGNAVSAAGIEVDVLAAGPEPAAAAYDAFIIGSGVYVGHWLAEARQFIEANRQVLQGRPVWLFSSGPVGSPAKPEGDPVDVAELMEATGARGHRVFAGRLDKSLLSFGERAMVTALRAPVGDFRDWAAIQAWGEEIARQLKEG